MSIFVVEWVLCVFNGGCMDLLNVSRVGLEDGVEYSGVCRVTVGEMKRRISDFVRMVDCKVDAFNLATKQKISKGEIKLRPWEDGFHPNEYFFDHCGMLHNDDGVYYVIARELGAYFHVEGVRWDFDEGWYLDRVICADGANHKKLIESYARHVGVEFPEFDYQIDGENLSMLDGDFETRTDFDDLRKIYPDDEYNLVKSKCEILERILDIAESKDINLGEVWEHIFSELGDSCEIEFNFRFLASE
jgi:hypothetical protein